MRSVHECGVVGKRVGHSGLWVDDGGPVSQGPRQAGVLGWRYAGAVPQLKTSYDEADLARLLDGAPPATPDEVSIINDGRRLDSAETVTAFFEELRERRPAPTGG